MFSYQTGGKQGSLNKEQKMYLCMSGKGESRTEARLKLRSEKGDKESKKNSATLSYRLRWLVCWAKRGKFWEKLTSTRLD